MLFQWVAFSEWRPSSEGGLITVGGYSGVNYLCAHHHVRYQGFYNAENSQGGGALKERMLHILIALDKLIYQLITLGYGSGWDTISSASYRMEQKGRLVGKLSRPVIDGIFSALGDKNHCFTSYISAKYKLPTKDF